MKRTILSLCLMSVALLPAQKITISSPNGSVQATVGLKKKGLPYYLVHKSGAKVIDTSALGLVRKDADFSSGLKFKNSSQNKLISNNYDLLHGKKFNVNYSANQQVYSVLNKNGEVMEIVFNVSDEGVAFQYRFPSTSKDVKQITQEKTGYKFASDAKGWLQPMSVAKTGWEQCNPAYEEYYEMGIPLNKKPSLNQGWIYPALVQTTTTWVAITEADLHEKYCGTHLNYDEKSKSMQIAFPQPQEKRSADAALFPESTLPWNTPWRVLAIGDLKTITESTLGTDLAAPSVTENTDFVKPGNSSWSWALLKDDSVNYDTTKEFIDYASKMNWEYCLIDVNWDERIGEQKIIELVQYAKEKNVKLILWYNSAGDWNTVKYTPKGKLLTEDGRNEVFEKLAKWGIAGVKIDFFGGDGQSMISYYHDILKSALHHNILVNFHGSTLPRGWHRTYPNLMTAEAVKGFEFITFFQDVADAAPAHMATLPFTRNLFDPMDFTPLSLDKIPNIDRRTSTAFELALPVLFLSGIQHMAETPEGMSKAPKVAAEYLTNIPNSWDESLFLDGFPGKFVVMARRKGDTWYISGINGENVPRSVVLNLEFVKNNQGIFITDGDNKGLTTEKIQRTSEIKIAMKAYGGFVMKF